MSEIKRYTIYENVSIYIPLLKGIEYLSDRVQIKDEVFTVFASTKNPYSWDGASPKWIFKGKICGTPDGLKDQLKFPTLFHDNGYEEQFASRTLIDEILKYLSSQPYLAVKIGNTIHTIKIDWKLSDVYYFFVRLFGWTYWYLRILKRLFNKNQK